MQNAIRPLYSKDITRSGQRQRFLWHQYSERCAAIAAVNFETVYPHFSQRKRMECLKALPSIDLNPILAQLPQRQCVVRI